MIVSCIHIHVRSVACDCISLVLFCVCMWLQYPAKLRGMDYDPEFAIRGLHCDSKNGLLMKIDAYNYIQKSSAYRCVCVCVCVCVCESNFWV